MRVADDSKLGDADNKLQGRATILRNPDRPEKQAGQKGPLLNQCISGYQWVSVNQGISGDWAKQDSELQ